MTDHLDIHFTFNAHSLSSNGVDMVELENALAKGGVVTFLKKIEAIELGVLNGFALRGELVKVKPIIAHVKKPNNDFELAYMADFKHDFPEVTPDALYQIGISVKHTRDGQHKYPGNFFVFSMVMRFGLGGRYGYENSDDANVTVGMDFTGFTPVWMDYAYQNRGGHNVFLTDGSESRARHYIDKYPGLNVQTTDAMISAIHTNPHYFSAVSAAIVFPYVYMNGISTLLVSPGVNANTSPVIGAIPSPPVDLEKAVKEGEYYLRQVMGEWDKIDQSRPANKAPDTTIRILPHPTKTQTVKVKRVVDKEVKEVPVYLLGLPNGWEWIEDVDKIALIARNGKIRSLAALVEDPNGEEVITEELATYMLEQAKELEILAGMYKMIAFGVLPGAVTRGILKRKKENNHGDDHRDRENLSKIDNSDIPF